MVSSFLDLRRQSQEPSNVSAITGVCGCVASGKGTESCSSEYSSPRERVLKCQTSSRNHLGDVLAWWDSSPKWALQEM